MTTSRPPREFPDGGPWTWGTPPGTIVYGWTPGAPPPDLSAPPPPPPAPPQSEPVHQPTQPEPVQEASPQDTAAPQQEPWPSPEADAWPDTDGSLPSPLGPALTPEERYHQLHGWHGGQDG